MKTLSKLLIINMIVLSCLNVNAQTEKVAQLEEKAHQAYISSSIFMWKQIVQGADQILNDSNTDSSSKIDAIKLKYGLLYCCLSNKDEETYGQYLDPCLKQLETLIKENPLSSELYSISAALMSVQMGFSPMKGMTLGAESGKQIDKAIELDSLNPMAWRQHASSKYFTPKMWGGDIQIAIKSYEHTIRLFEKENNTKDWIYLDALAWLGIAYEKNGETEKAKLVYEKALAIEPNFTWVKNHLLPALIKK